MQSTRSKILSAAGAIALALTSLSCSDKVFVGDAGLRPNDPRFSEAPGVFSWLPPLGAGSANASTFDATAANRVEICVWSGGACTGALVAQFATTPAPGTGTLTVNTTVGRYEATWSLSNPAFLTRKTYKLRAMNGTTELGAILVDAIRGRWALTKPDGSLAPLLAATDIAIQFHVALPPPPPIFINEIESNGGSPDDWVELYNAGTTAIDLGGFAIRDNDDSPSHLYVMPAGTMIAPGGYRVFDTGTTFSFGLGAPDAVRLYRPSGAVLDSYSWATHAATTYGRCPNGTGPFVTTTSSTKGTANDCSVPVKINEVESDDGSNPDWIELYNPAGVAIDLSGYVLKDNDDTHIFTIPAGTSIAAGGFLAFDALGFGLGSADAARFYAPGTSGALLDSYSWMSHAATTYGRCPDGSGSFVTTGKPTKGAANNCTSPIPLRINEVESDDGSNPDWIELMNIGASTIDLSGYVLKDNDDTHIFTIPAGTTLAAGAFKAFDALGFGLGAADAARLFTPAGVVVDSYSWTSHATTTYGRCPNGTGDFTTTSIATKGASNSCPGGPPTAAAWPGGPDITTVDQPGFVSSNLSGLMYEAGAGPGGSDVLWAARNGPGSIYRLLFDGTNWVPDATNGWGAGKLVHYTDGTGEPDTEDLTFTTGSLAGMYTSTERDNSHNTISRTSILRYDVTGSGTELTATNEWNLTADLPAVGPNLGLEAIAWIPDAYLLSKSFYDVNAGHLYNPAEYADHGDGVFLVGVEGTGMVHIYALNHVTNGFTRIASISTGFPAGVMSLQFDRELGNLWATCDDTCGGLSDIFEIDQSPGPTTLGRLKLTHIFNRPSGMGNFNNEGFALTPLSKCASGFRPVFWADDSADLTHSIRRGTLACPAFP